MINKKIFYILAAVLLMSLAGTSVVLAAETTAATDPETQKVSNPPATGEKKHDLAKLGKKLANPLGEVWALFTEFDFSLIKGDISDDHTKGNWNMLLQPILPIPLTENWKLITRPTLPVFFNTPVPEANSNGDVSFNYKGGLGDLIVPALFTKNPKKGNHWMFGFGPTFKFPTASNDLGSKTWEAGPAAVVVHSPPKYTSGFLAQYWWNYAETNNDAEDTSHGELLVFYLYNLPDAWQIGFNPTISYNDKASSGNKWNVPIGPIIVKMVKIGKVPMMIQVGVEYSIVNEDDFGKQWMFRLNLIPVIPGLIQKPLF